MATTFVLDPQLSEAEAGSAIAKAMAAGTLSAADAGRVLADWMKGSKAAKPKWSKTAHGAVYMCWGKGGSGIQRSLATDKAGWEAVAKAAAEILKTWDSIPMSATAKLTLEDPEAAARKKQEYLARRAAKSAA